jgi:hypothetical protein
MPEAEKSPHATMLRKRWDIAREKAKLAAIEIGD